MKSQTTQECISLISLSHGVTYTVMTVLQGLCWTCCPGRARTAFDLFYNSSSEGMEKPLPSMPQTFSGEQEGLGWRRRWKHDGKAALKIFFPTKLLQCTRLLGEKKTRSAVYVKGRSLVCLLLRWEEKQETQRKSQTLFFTNKAAVTFSGKSTLLRAAHHAQLHPSRGQPKCLCFPESQSWRSLMGSYRLLLFRTPNTSPKALGLAAAISVCSPKAKEQNLWGRRLKMD